VFVTDATYKDASGSATFSKIEQVQFDSILSMAEGSLQKAQTVLNDFNTSDPLAVGYKLKSFFNFYIRNSQGDMARVKN
jgi:hypothetical protein